MAGVLLRAAIGLCVTLVAGAASASTLQITRDRGRALISSDVGTERWAITFDPARASITGNVFSEGQDPQFVDCDLKERTAEDLIFACYGADSCTSATCGDWNYLRDVTLPKDFVLAPDGSRPVLDAPCPDLSGTWMFNLAGDCLNLVFLYFDIEQSGCTFHAGETGPSVFEGVIQGPLATFTIEIPEFRPPPEPPSDCVATASGTAYVTSEALHAAFDWTTKCCQESPAGAFAAVRLRGE